MRRASGNPGESVGVWPDASSFALVECIDCGGLFGRQLEIEHLKFSSISSNVGQPSRRHDRDSSVLVTPGRWRSRLRIVCRGWVSTSQMALTPGLGCESCESLRGSAAVNGHQRLRCRRCCYDGWWCAIGRRSCRGRNNGICDACRQGQHAEPGQDPSRAVHCHFHQS